MTEANTVDFRKTPPSFPFLVEQARNIFFEMFDNMHPLSSLTPEQRTCLGLSIQDMLEKSFWGGVYAQNKDTSPKFFKCLESIYDTDLDMYWRNFRKSVKPPLIRPVTTTVLGLVSYFKDGDFQKDLENFKNLLTPIGIQPEHESILLVNIKTLCEIVGIDAMTLTNDFCAQDATTRNQEFAQIQKAQTFQPQTFMISKKTFYILTSMLVAGSLTYSVYRQRTLAREHKQRNLEKNKNSNDKTS